MTKKNSTPHCDCPQSKEPPVWVEAKNYGIALYTDGSCYYKDKIGGCCAVVAGSRYGVFEIAKVSSTHTTVERMELEALLSGLQAFLDAAGLKDRKKLVTLRVAPITVFWLTDRLNLCQSVNRELPRSANGDMWARLEWYERYFKISGFHAGRNTNAYQAVSDLISSECRKLMKNHETDYTKIGNR